MSAAVRTEETWQLKALCRGPQAVVFFAPAHAETKDEKTEREQVGEVDVRVLPGETAVPRLRVADPGTARHLGRAERGRAEAADRACELIVQLAGRESRSSTCSKRRALHPDISTIGATSFASRVGDFVEGLPGGTLRVELGERPRVPGSGERGVDGQRTEKLDADGSGELRTSSFTEERVSVAVARIRRPTCSRSRRRRARGPCAPCPRRAGATLAAADDGVVTTRNSARGNIRDKRHLHVAGARRHVDEQVVEVSPVDIL